MAVLRRSLGAILVLLGVAGWASAQQRDPAPSPRAKWEELHGTFTCALSSHSSANLKLREVERQLAVIKGVIAPLESRVAELAKTRAASDPEYAAAQKLKHERIIALRFGELSLEHDALVHAEFRLRSAAIESGWAALTRMFHVADLMERGAGPRREEQREYLLDKCYQVMKDLDALEEMPGPTLPTFNPVDVATLGPSTPFDFMIGSREEDARRAEQLAGELVPRIERNRQAHARLLKLIEAGVMMRDRVQDNLKKVDSRLAELTRLHDASKLRAQALRDDAQRLRQRKEEIRREIGLKSTSERP